MAPEFVMTVCNGLTLVEGTLLGVEIVTEGMMAGWVQMMVLEVGCTFDNDFDVCCACCACNKS